MFVCRQDKLMNFDKRIGGVGCVVGCVTIRIWLDIDGDPHHDADTETGFPLFYWQKIQDFSRTFQVLEFSRKKNQGLSRRRGNPAGNFLKKFLPFGNRAIGRMLLNCKKRRDHLPRVSCSLMTASNGDTFCVVQVFTGPLKWLLVCPLCTALV